MKLTGILLFASITFASAASSYGQTTLLSLNIDNQPVQIVLDQIEAQSEFHFFYNNKQLDTQRIVSISCEDDDIFTVLSSLFEGTDMTYKVLDRNIILTKQDKPAKSVKEDAPVIIQDNPVSGTITDNSGETIIGAYVLEKGTSNGTFTDVDGKFSFTLKNPEATLVISYMGYVEQEVVVDGRSVIDIVLIPDTQVLEEVVVVGYGVQKKKLITGANLNVKGDDIQKRNTQNALDALVGQSPGVQITQSSGQPGEDMRVTVRGLGTVGDATPLYVVDGVQLNSISHIHPSEIESIDVLKDAASAAIYGARAANGVLLITTKSGKSGKTTIGYDGYLGIQNLVRMPQMLNAQDYMTIMDEASVNSGGSAYDWLREFNINPNTIGNGTNWLDELVEPNALTQNHNVSVSGGSDVSTFALSLGYSGQEGVIGGKDYSNNSRYNFRINSTHKLFKDILRIGEHISLSYIERQGILIGNQYNNIIHDALQATPVLTPYNEDGTDFAQATLFYPEEINPLASLSVRNNNNNQTARMSGDIFVELRPIKDLVIKSSFALDYSNNNYRSYVPEYYYGTGFYNDTDYAIQRNNLRTSWSLENTANYKFTLGKNHNFDVLAGMQMRQEGGQYLSVQKYDLIFDDFEHGWISNATNANANMVTVSGYPRDKDNLVSFFGRISYDFKEKYLFTASLRADGSSKFGYDNRYGIFPSVSAGWVVSSEEFMKSLSNTISFLKLRASWGQNGNNRISDYAYLATIGTTSYAFGAEDNQTSTTTGVYENSMPNLGVRWETSEQLDLGLDIHFFGGKLQMAMDYYNKTTKDWLLQVDVLDVYGAAANPFINGGSVRNNGFEFAASFAGGKGDGLHYSISGNVAYNKNEVISIPNQEGVIHGSQDVLFKGMQEMNRAEVGYPIGYFWGLNKTGIFQNQSEIDNYKNSAGKVIQPDAHPGDAIFADTDDDGEITQSDNVFLGQPYPKVTAGLSLSLDYKGFDLYVAASGSFGMQVAKSYRPMERFQFNYTTDILNRWTGEGTSNVIPRVTNGDEANGNWRYLSQLYIENADFVRLNNITLGYNFTRLFKEKNPFGQLRAYVTIQNALVITKYSGMDPEVGYNGGTTGSGDGNTWSSGIDLGFYPRSRTILFGISVKL